MSKHIKMVSNTSGGEEEEEWLEDNHQRNGNARIGFKKGGRVSQMTRLEKIFLVLLFILLVALIAVIIALVVKENKDNQDTDVCTTAGCVSAAAYVGEQIDYTMEPCEDFYQFACGKWMSGKVIPEDRASVTTFSQMRNDVDIKLKNLLEAPISDADHEFTQTVKTLYASCLDYDLINKRGVQPLIDLINSEYGGWPLTNATWDESAFNFTTTMIRLNINSCFPMLLLFAGVDSKNSTQRVLQVDQTGFGLPGQKYYLLPRNDTMLMVYQTLIYEIGDVFGFADKSQAEKEVENIVDFEIKLAHIVMSEEVRRDNSLLYNPTTLEEMSKNYSQILDWKRYVKAIMTAPGIEVKDVTDDEIIINRSPSYLEKLNDLIEKTSKRILANYLMWRQVYDLISTQGDIIKNVLTPYNKVVIGRNIEPPRFQTCVELAKSICGWAVGRMFVTNYFDAESKTMALDMITDLRRAFSEILDQNDWMDEQTKEIALEKHRRIISRIGYPEEVMNVTLMNEVYANYTFQSDKYLENVLLSNRESYKYHMKQLRDAVDKSKANFAPAAVNAYYNPATNEITFPAGILQSPFFSKTFPRSMNFGGIGVVIGHEITHGFDDVGRQYDKDGNLKQWWSKSAEQKFRAKSQCIVNQYSNFSMDSVNMNLNGITTLGENIADNGGVKQSFKAYRNWVERQGHEEAPLPGLNFSHDQLFFINFAQLWCSLMTDGDVINRILTGSHAPGEFRVKGTAQNSNDFNRVFKCSKTSKMNPENKCSVW